MANLMIPLERIDAEARKLHPMVALVASARLVGTLLLALPYVLGWALRKAWLGLTMLWTAAVVGWQDAGTPRVAASQTKDDPT